ncbi:MAG: hypothetical protein ACI4J0_01660 [Huintestinicola sp.]|uniref:hypothetical protein n=1 Tax=Huintestinicola sp. TaxID=2981661 RepID=UPI003F129BDB
MNFKKITAMLFAALISMTLTACLHEKEPLSPYELYSHTSDNIDSETIREAVGEELESVTVMSAENSEKFRAAVSDIRINNSRIALPVLVSDLPEGFQVQYEKGERLNEDYMYFDGELIFGGERIAMSDGGAVIKGGEKLADLVLLKERRAGEAEGVIFSVTLSSDKCKWSAGEADICSPSELERIFGTPSAEASSDENVPDLFYVSDSGEFARFMPAASSVMIASLDCTRLEENKALCKYVPYNDFDNMPDLPPLTGEPRRFEALSVLNDSAVTIGELSCAPYIPISELDGDISLIHRETAPIEDTESVSDKYILLYKGRYFGSVTAMRKSHLPVGEGVIYAWFLNGREDIPCDASLAGIPVSADTQSIADHFENSELKDDGSLVMYEACELEGQKFLVFYSRNSGISALITEPISE